VANELSDINIVRLALGGIFALMAADDLKPVEYARLSQDPKIRNRAKEIVLLEAARLADGEQIDESMRFLIGVWCRRHVDSNTPGRPDAWVKETALCVAYYEKMHKYPGHKREAVIEELMKEFGLNRRRVFDILKNAGPRRPRR
jgi:hypothetical protein